MRRQLILIAATWAAVAGLVAGGAHAQSATSPGGQFVLVGVVMLEGGRGLAWVQEPNFTNNKVVTVRLGDSVGPYRVTKILTHQVELTGPGGTVSVPLAGLPGAVSVASSAGTEQRPAGELSPPPALQQAPIIIPLDDPRRHFPASRMLVGAGAVITGAPSQALQPQAAPSQATPAHTVPVPTAVQAPTPGAPPHVIIIPPGDPRGDFPASRILIGG